MRTISQSVGHNGVNFPPDVREIQFLLNRVAPQDGGPKTPHKQDGNCTQKLIQDIHAFQLHHFGWSGADGRVDPGHQTLQKLNELNPEPLTTTKFLLTQLSPNAGLQPNRNQDWFFEILPVDGNTQLRYSIFWLGTSLNPSQGPPSSTPARSTNTFLNATSAITVSELAAPASFTTTVFPGGRKKSVLRISYNGGVATAEFENNHWRGHYFYKHLEHATVNNRAVHYGKFWSCSDGSSLDYHHTNELVMI
jgi:hypothetical protein